MTSDEDLDDIAKKIKQLPPDWWQTTVAALTLRKASRSHVIPLLAAGFVGREFQYSVYTGILLRHRATIVWLTAGHVVDELLQLLSSPSFKISTMMWLDDFGVKEAEGVRLHRTNIPMKSWKRTGLDLGAVLPSELDVGNILKNNKVRAINSGVWKNLSPVRPEGFYALGFPRPWTDHKETPDLNNKILHSVKADIACLPLEAIRPPAEFSEDLAWSDPNAFYGKILPYPDYPTFNIDQLKGMSGGPVLSVERTEDGNIYFRLVGVIQSWAWAQSIIRAEPIERVAKAIDEWLDERNIISSAPK
jgi:hypothetical protein